MTRNRPLRAQSTRRRYAEQERLALTRPSDRLYVGAVEALTSRMTFAAERGDLPGWLVLRVHLDLVLGWWVDSNRPPTPTSADDTTT